MVVLHPWQNSLLILDNNLTLTACPNNADTVSRILFSKSKTQIIEITRSSAPSGNSLFLKYALPLLLLYQGVQSLQSLYSHQIPVPRSVGTQIGVNRPNSSKVQVPA